MQDTVYNSQGEFSWIYQFKIEPIASHVFMINGYVQAMTT